MEHGGLIATIALCLVAAFAGGFIARQLRISPIVGYLVAGIALGPFTPGLFADPEIAIQLADIGVILLMFGVGIHFSLRDLLAVRGVAIPGAVAQSAVATVLGIGLALLIGWDLPAGLVLGLALAVASTVVLLRALTQRNELTGLHGQVAVGWLIVEDLFTVVILVLLPSLALVVEGSGTGVTLLGPLALALGKAALLGVLMVVVGARFVPWILVRVARDGSRELFTLAVLAVALGIAFASSALFGVSLALGAFLAGAIVGETDVSHKAAFDALPFRDAFAVLFFVSVGMLFDPAFLVENPLEIVAVVALIVVGKSLAALGIVSLLRYPIRTGLTVGAGLSQIGEFSFILASAGATLALLPPEAFQLIVAGALISISLNPVLFALVDRLDAWFKRHPTIRRRVDGTGGALARPPAEAPLVGHTVLCGHGRVGQLVARALEGRGFPYVVIEEDRRVVEQLRASGRAAIYGDCADEEVLRHAGIRQARALVLAAPNPPAAEAAIAHSLEVNPRIQIVARVETTEEGRRLKDRGVAHVVEAERELAVQVATYTLRRLGVSGREAELISQGLRGRPMVATTSGAPE
jgi:CPA2 family monovalent cation:H+ antiporter-2